MSWSLPTRAGIVVAHIDWRGRAFILFGGLLAGTLAGGWLGLVAAFVSGIATSEPPRFPEKTSWRQSSSAGCWPPYAPSFRGQPRGGSAARAPPGVAGGVSVHSGRRPQEPLLAARRAPPGSPLHTRERPALATVHFRLAIGGDDARSHRTSHVSCGPSSSHHESSYTQWLEAQSRCYASRIKRGGYSMRIFAPLLLTLVVSVLLTGCRGQETPVEETEEDSGVKGTLIEETMIEETKDRAEATVEETTAAAEATAPEPPAPGPAPDGLGGVRGPQEEESIKASPKGAIREHAQTEEGISATQTVAPDPATVGSPLIFTVVVTNNSSTQHVGLKDFLPSDMTFVSATPGQGFCGPPHHGGNLVDCTLSTIPTGVSVAVEIVAIPTAPGTMTNLAQVGGGFAPVQSVPATVTVNPQPE
jgi:uncharacterized repeat protein (TIGR01451 family)